MLRNTNGIFGLALAVACALPLGCGDDSATGAGGSTTTDNGGGPSDGGNGAGGQAQGGSGGSISDGGEGGGSDPECSEITLEDFVRGDFAGEYFANVDQALGGADHDQARLQFFNDTTGTIALGTGENDNWKTCSQCLFVDEDVPDQDEPGRYYFQSSGSIVIDAQSRPTTAGVVATLTDVTLVEVTIAPDDTSTPVPNGECLHITSATVNLPPPPAAWVCDEGIYDNDDGCDCGCGAPDPDCMDTAQLVYGCGLPHAGTQTSSSQCDATGTCAQPATWTCAAAQYNDGAECNCNCGGNDIDCENLEPVTGCQQDQFCSTTSTCVAGTGGEVCATATPLTPGITYGTLAGKAGTLDPGAGGCTASDEAGPDVVYSVSLTAGQWLNAWARQADNDVAVYLLSSSACDAASQCVKGADAGVEGESEVIFYVAPTTGTYYLVVDSWYTTNTSPFVLYTNIF